MSFFERINICTNVNPKIKNNVYNLSYKYT